METVQFDLPILRAKLQSMLEHRRVTIAALGLEIGLSQDRLWPFLKKGARLEISERRRIECWIGRR